MRVLFTVSSWPTHYAAMVPIGWALQATGHEVRVLCQPSQATPVASAGLVPIPVLDGMDVSVYNRLQYYREAVTGNWPYPWLAPHPLTGRPLERLGDFDEDEYRRTAERVFAARSRESFDRAVDIARRWRPDLVLHDPASLEGLLVARVIGVASALCLWGPVGTREREHMRIVPTDLSRSFERYGLGEFSLDMIDTVVDPCPASLTPPTSASTRLPVRFVPYNGCGPAPVWLLDEPRRPRVAVTWSTALSTMSGPGSYLLPTVVQALAELDCETVVTATARDVAALGPVPPTVRVLENLPLRLLLPSCAAVVHHGGSGSVMTAIWAGVPQLTATFASEQTVSGMRLAATGAAVHLLGHLATVETIQTWVSKLLADAAYADAAGSLRSEMLSRPTMAELVTRLEGMV